MLTTEDIGRIERMLRAADAHLVSWPEPEVDRWVAGIRALEAERDELRARCGRLDAALRDAVVWVELLMQDRDTPDYLKKRLGTKVEGYYAALAGSEARAGEGE